MKKIFGSLFTVAVLAGCATPQQGLVVTNEALATFDGADPRQIVPSVSSKSFISTFQQMCEKNLKDLRLAIPQLRAAGYITLATKDEVIMYAHKGGRPLVALAGDNPNKPEFCMVMTPDNPTVRASVTKYASSRPGAVSFPIKGVMPGAEGAWVTNQAIYITVTEKSAAMGTLFALGAGLP